MLKFLNITKYNCQSRALEKVIKKNYISYSVNFLNQITPDSGFSAFTALTAHCFLPIRCVTNAQSCSSSTRFCQY